MRKMLLAAVAVCVAQPAMAAEWLNVGQTPNGAWFAIDLASAKRVGRYIAVWQRKTLDGHEEFKALNYHNCEDGSFANKHLSTYKADGSVATVSTTQTDDKLIWQMPTPESIGWGIQEAACRVGRALPR